MKHKKIYLCLFVFLLIFALTACQSGEQTFYNVNTMHTATSFGFTDNGEAYVNVSYLGYQDTTGAVIDIKIEKAGFLLIWNPIAEQTFFAEGEEYQNEFFYPLTENGKYRCTVTYTVSGKGENDVIVFKDEKTYRKENSYAQTTDTSLTETTSTETTATETTESTTTTEITTTETTTTPEIPAISASEFAEKLSLALAEKEAHNTEFQIEKTITRKEQSYQTNILTSIQSDFRDDVLYSYFSTADSQTESFENYYIFINDTIYVSKNGDRYQKPLSQDEFAEKTPRHALSLLFGGRLHDAFSNAKITAAEDGSMTASLEIPFAAYYDPMIRLIEFLTNDNFQEQTIHNYWNFVQVEVTLDKNGDILCYSFAFSYDVIKDDGSIPTQYIIKATENEVDLDNFRKYLLPQEYLEQYPTEKPQNPEQPQDPVIPPQEPLTVEQEEFLTLFYDAYAKWNPNRYKIKITSSSRWHFDGLFSVDIPLTQSIIMDCTDPHNPTYHQQAIISDTSGYSQTDIYFINDRLYVSDYEHLSQTPLKSERKYSVIMLSDYFLTDAQFDWLFFREDMLNDAQIIKNEDGSFTASMKVSGYGTEFRELIKATYGDDFSDEYINDVLLSHNVKMTIDDNGYLTEMTVSGQMQVTDTRNGSRTIIHYTFFIEPDYTDFYIDFPDDLDAYEDITEEYYRE